MNIRRQDEYAKQIEKEWAEAKKQVQEERDNALHTLKKKEGYETKLKK